MTFALKYTRKGKTGRVVVAPALKLSTWKEEAGTHSEFHASLVYRQPGLLHRETRLEKRENQKTGEETKKAKLSLCVRSDVVELSVQKSNWGCLLFRANTSPKSHMHIKDVVSPDFCP